MNDTFRFIPRQYCGAPSISFSSTEGKDKTIISIRDAFMNPKTMVTAVTRLMTAGADDKVIILINSFGGDVSALRQLLAAMHACKATIETHVTGIAASCGAMAWLYGDTLSMSESALVMFHGSSNFGISGNTMEIAEQMGLLVENMREILKPTIEKGILTEEEFTNMLEGKSDIFLSHADLNAKGVL